VIQLYYVTNLDDPSEGTLVANADLARDAIISEIKFEADSRDEPFEEIERNSPRWFLYESPNGNAVTPLEGAWVLKDEEFWYYYEVKMAETVDEYAELSPDMR
jgi:hypothetical protein